jgi:hypothetical protein
MDIKTNIETKPDNQQINTTEKEKQEKQEEQIKIIECNKQSNKKDTSINYDFAINYII